MRNTIYLLLTTLVFCCTTSLNAQSAQELIANGNAVYIEINDVNQNAEQAYEVFRSHLLSDEWNRWNLVESPEEADFICRLNIEKKGFNVMSATSMGARVRVVTEILTPAGKSVWKSKKQQGNVSVYTGGDALSDAMRKVIRRSLKEELYRE